MNTTRIQIQEKLYNNFWRQRKKENSEIGTIKTKSWFYFTSIRIILVSKFASNSCARHCLVSTDAISRASWFRATRKANYSVIMRYSIPQPTLRGSEYTELRMQKRKIKPKRNFVSRSLVYIVSLLAHLVLARKFLTIYRKLPTMFWHFRPRLALNTQQIDTKQIISE